MAATSIVFTARYAASLLGVDIKAIAELAGQMAPEDGCLCIIDSLDEDAKSTAAFTRRGLEYLDDLLDQRRSDLMHES